MNTGQKNKKLLPIPKIGLVFMFSFLLSLSALSSGIIGGSLSYQNVGSTNYKIILHLYSECTATPPTSVTIGVRDGNGNLTSLDFTMSTISSTQLPPILDTCAMTPAFCIKEVTYTKTVNLPASATGYHLFYETSPRISNINNIYLSQLSGATYNTYIPGTTIPNNSSPQWNNQPPAYVCVGNNFSFDFSASDVNGDSITYSFYTPYGDSSSYANPYFDNSTIPNNIHFIPLVWMPGYSGNNPFNASTGSPLILNSQTGIISGIPESIGYYLVGIKCEEYRNGVKIGEIIRDFTFVVRNCPSSFTASIGHLNGCNGHVIQMQNESPSWVTSFQWDFGDGSSPVNGYEPSHTYATDGVYTVTLISNQGTPCADTATKELKIGQVIPDFTSEDSLCISDSIQFTPTTTTTGGLIPTSWQWDFGDSTALSNAFNPFHQFDSAGFRNVQLLVGTDGGCYGLVTKPIYVGSLPEISVVSDTFACINNPNIVLNVQVNNAVGAVWQGNGTFIPSPTNLSVIYSPSSSDLANGSAFILVNTTGNDICQSAQEHVTITYFDSSYIDIGYSINACNTMDSVPLTAVTQYAIGMTWSTTNGTGTFSAPTDPLTFYFPSNADYLSDSICIIATTSTNSACVAGADTIWMKFNSPNTTSMNYPTDICEYDAIVIDASSSTGNGMWSSINGGIFSNATGNNTTYNYSPVDFLNQQAVIYFQTTQNGGCPPKYDTLIIDIHKLPHPDFTYTHVCYGKPTIFTSTTSTVDPIATYKWTYSGNSFSSTSQPSFIVPTPSTAQITLFVTTSNGCSDSITKPVKTLEVPTADFSFTSACADINMQFNDSTHHTWTSITDWQWNFGDGTTSNVENPVHQYHQTGNKTIQLIVESSNGCRDTVVKTVNIEPQPTAAFSMSPNPGHEQEVIQFTDASQSNSTLIAWNWDLGDGNTSAQQNPSHPYNDAGEYWVTLVIQTANKCSDTLLKKVKIIDQYFTPKVPTAFSPNGDGKNDILYMYGGAYKSAIFRIYNNWGQVIFESNASSIGWDGKFKGKLQPEGVYVWTIDSTDFEGTTYKNSGNITLVR